MNIFANRDVKKFFAVLAVIISIGIILTGAITYLSAVRFKSGLISHDYIVAGYLAEKYPEMASGIKGAFTTAEQDKYFEKGRELLNEAAYNESTDINLIPATDSFYKTGILVNSIADVLVLLMVLGAVCGYIKRNYMKIDRFNDDIVKIMEGAISTRLNDGEEGSLSKLAASINVMTSSLHSHIEKEKQDRIFLKDTLTNISHQLKTPLSALFMYTEIMKEEHVENKVIESFLDKSQRELERMRMLTASLLKLARLDAGFIELDRKRYILNDIIRQAVESFETQAANEDKTLLFADGNEVWYNCDREWMLEVLSNLIKNAMEHTGKAGSITVSLEETPLIVRMSVSDNGEGIHQDDINHIFKSFYRSKFSKNRQGTGIGLTLAKLIVEMHDGFISVDSMPGNGTIFVINLPKLTKL